MELASPQMTPDNILLSLNSAGAMQLKPGTQGDLLYAGASGVWAKLAVGTSGFFLKSNGAGQNPSWSAPGDIQGWVKVETLTPSSSTTISTAGDYSTYDEIMFRIQVYGTAGDDLGMRLNADSGANYGYTQISTTTITRNTAQSSAKIATWGNNGSYKVNCVVSIPAVCGAASAGGLQINNHHGLGNTDCKLGGYWSGGNGTRVTSATFFSGNSFTGKIECFGRVFQ